MPATTPTETPLARADELRGAGQLATEAVAGLADLVEAMHGTIVNTVSRAAGIDAAPRPEHTGGITGMVYRGVRGVTKLVGVGLDAVLAGTAPLLGASRPSAEREAVLAALNGVLGDHLADTGNPLALPMQLRHRFEPLVPQAPALAAAIPAPSRRVIVLLHGLCMPDRCWQRHEQDLAAELAAQLGGTLLTLQYNSGRHVSTNGRDFAALLQAVLDAWPVPVAQLVLIGHSMGGLVARSAVHAAEAAGHAWRRHLAAMAFLGTPHHGSPLERGGHHIDLLLQWSAYTAPFARLGRIRSAGITDLRHGNLLDEDWNGVDRFASGRDRRHPVPLPTDVPCFALAATLAAADASPLQQRLGDGLVPLASALGDHREHRFALRLPESRRAVLHATGHLDLLDKPEVYTQLGVWLAPVLTTG